MSKRLAKKVLLIGWDAADWAICEPLLAQGVMPNLQRLIENGSCGKLASVMPMLSHVAWTSVATGKRPYKHGIHGMLEPDPAAGGVRPASSLSRATSAIWNILTQNGLTAHVVGWPGAHPAESIRGINVTDRHAIARLKVGKPWPQPEGSFHPPEVGAAVAALRVHPDELDREFLAFFVPQLEQIDAAKVGRLSAVSRWLAATATSHAVATWTLEQRGWDLAAFCYAAIGQVSHAFLPYMPPKQAAISSDDFEIYRHVVPACYQFHDRMLGRLLELAGDETTVILHSGYGCKTGAMRPQRLGGRPEDVEAWRRRSGMFVAHGPHIRRGMRINDASILDVTPTLLTLFGLPVGDDMDGRPLFDLLEFEVELKHLPSWDEAPGVSGSHPMPKPESHLELTAMLSQLKEMGYRDPQEDELAASQQRVIDWNQFNLARSLIDGGRVSAAIEILEPLADKSPPAHGVVGMLLEAYLLAGRLDDILRRIDQLPPAFALSPLVGLMLGRVELARRRPRVALDHFIHAAALDATNVRVQVYTGQAYLNLRQWRGARGAFQRALDLEPNHPEALFGLCVVCLKEGDATSAVKFGSAAVESNPSLPAAHFHLGVALHALGRSQEAATELEFALRLNPELRAARRMLIRLYDGALGEPARAAEHAQWIEHRGRGRLRNLAE